MRQTQPHLFDFRSSAILASPQSSSSSPSSETMPPTLRPFAKQSLRQSHTRLKEKAVEKLLCSSEAKRKSFINNFRRREGDLKGRCSLIKELMADIVPETLQEQHEKNSVLEYLDNFSLEEGFEYSELYLEIEGAIQHELLGGINPQPPQQLEEEEHMDHLIDEEMEAYDSMLEDNVNDIICPLCWVNNLAFDQESNRLFCRCSSGWGQSIINLRSNHYQNIFTPSQLKNLLSEVYERHLKVCHEIRSMYRSADTSVTSPGCGLVCSISDNGSLIGNCQFCGFNEVIL